MRILKIGLRILGYVLLCPLVVIAWLSVPSIDWSAQYVAQFIVEAIGPIIWCILAIGTAITLRRWRISRRPAFLIAFLLVASGILAGTYTLASQYVAAASQGIWINPLAALWPRSPEMPDAEPRAFVYDQLEGEPARLFVFEPARRRTAPAPIIVYVHGGGWVQGAASQRSRDMRWFADQGYLVISVDYALSSPGRHLWSQTQPQIACALAWVGQNAQKLGGNTKQIGLFGESAGANLVLNIGNLLADGGLKSGCGGSVPVVRAVVAVYPPVDMAALYRHPASTQYPQAYIGGAPGAYPARYAAVSPSASLRPASTPALILAGLQDSLVPVSDTIAYARRARAIEAPVKLVTVPRAGHGFDLFPNSMGNQIVRQATLTFFADTGMSPDTPLMHRQ